MFATKINRLLCVTIAISCGLAYGRAFAAEVSESAVRQPSLTSLRSNSSLLAISYRAERAIAVGAYGKIVVIDTPNVASTPVSQVPCPTDVTLTSVAAGGRGVWIAGGHEGTLVRSDDNGSTWRLVQTDPNAPPVLAVRFLKNMFWTAVGGNGSVLISSDDGESWSQTNLSVYDDEFEFDPHLFDVIRLSNGGLLASGEQGYVFVSYTNGRVWRPIKTEYPGSIFSLVQASTNSVIAFGMSGHSLVSTDNGEHWTAPRAGPQGSIFSAKIISERLMVAGSSGMFGSATDVGELHKIVNQPIADFVQDPSGDYWLATSSGLQRATPGAFR